MTEKGIKLGTMTLDGLDRAGGFDAAVRDYKWFYLGAEFCENLIDEAVCGEAVRLQGLGKKVCLLTPMLSEKGIVRLDAVFKKLLKLVRLGSIKASGLEITVNDFGAVELARQNRLPFKLNSGRLLYDNIFDGTRRMLKAHSALGFEFFKELGITRHEISTTGLRRRSNFTNAGAPGPGSRKFSLTLFYPYLNLTSARTCLVGMRDVEPEDSAKGVTCARECRICSFAVTHPSIKEKLVVRGNTVFLHFPGKFYRSEEALAALRVDRLVYCPFQ